MQAVRRSRQPPQRDLVLVDRNTTHRRQVSRHVTNPALTTDLSHNSSQNYNRKLAKKSRDTSVIPADQLPARHPTQRKRPFMRPSKNTTRRSNSWPMRSSFWHKGLLISFQERVPGWTMTYHAYFFNRAKIPTLPLLQSPLPYPSHDATLYKRSKRL